MNQPTEPEFLDDGGLKKPDRSSAVAFVTNSVFFIDAPGIPFVLESVQRCSARLSRWADNAGTLAWLCPCFKIP
jgi:hypothetical protein